MMTFLPNHLSCMSPCNLKSSLHTESRRNARKAFLALSSSKNDEDQDQSSDKPSLDQAAVGSLEEMRISENTPVSRISVIWFIACILVWFINYVTASVSTFFSYFFVTFRYKSMVLGICSPNFNQLIMMAILLSLYSVGF